MLRRIVMYELLLVLVPSAFIIVALLIWKSKSNNRKNEKISWRGDENPYTDNYDMKTRENGEIDWDTWLTSMFCSIGCQPEKEEGVDGFLVQFQGEWIRVRNHLHDVRLEDLSWFQIKGDDPMIGEILEAINETNLTIYGPTVFLTPPDNEGTRHVWSRFDIVMHRSLEEGSDYLTSRLLMFFNAKREFHEILNRRKTAVKFGTDGITLN